eukprot:758357-Hanusia_phi.AAC.2
MFVAICQRKLNLVRRTLRARPEPWARPAELAVDWDSSLTAATVLVLDSTWELRLGNFNVLSLRGCCRGPGCEVGSLAPKIGLGLTKGLGNSIMAFRCAIGGGQVVP